MMVMAVVMAVVMVVMVRHVESGGKGRRQWQFRKEVVWFFRVVGPGK